MFCVFQSFMICLIDLSVHHLIIHLCDAPIVGFSQSMTLIFFCMCKYIKWMVFPLDQ